MDDMEYEMHDDVTDEQEDEMQTQDEYYFFGMYSISDFCDFPVCPF